MESEFDDEISIVPEQVERPKISGTIGLILGLAMMFDSVLSTPTPIMYPELDYTPPISNSIPIHTSHYNENKIKSQPLMSSVEIDQLECRLRKKLSKNPSKSYRRRLEKKLHDMGR